MQVKTDEVKQLTLVCDKKEEKLTLGFEKMLSDMRLKATKTKQD